MRVLGTRIRKLRKENNFTLRELGEKLNMSFSILAMYERGERTPPVDKLLMLADFFSVSVDYLLGKSDNKKYLSNDIAAATGDYIVKEDRDCKAIINSPKKDFFCIKVEDDSMKDCRILKGDYVCIKRDVKIRDGDVVLLVNKKDNDYFIREIFSEGEKVILKPANSKYEQQIYNRKEIEIIGRVVKVIFEL
ncbi:MAG: LexA family protein [Halanaerobiaceae bacterium]